MPEALANSIEGQGYTTEAVQPAKDMRAESRALKSLIRFEDEPGFYREGLARAAKNASPILLDFSAEWCGPCHRLKEQTFKDPEVAKVLRGFEVLVIDTDAHPNLAKAFGVVSVPDVVLASPSGRVLDRFTGFEEAKPFLDRLRRVLKMAGQESPGAR